MPGDGANGAATQPAVKPFATAGGPEGSSSSPRETDDDARKRRRIERFSPPTPSEIALGKSVEAAARIAAGRAIDWAARAPNAGDTSRIIMLHHDDSDCRAATRKKWADAGLWLAQKRPATDPPWSNRPDAVANAAQDVVHKMWSNDREKGDNSAPTVQDVAQEGVHKTGSKRNGPNDTGQEPEVVVQDGRARAAPMMSADAAPLSAKAAFLPSARDAQMPCARAAQAPGDQDESAGAAPTSPKTRADVPTVALAWLFLATRDAALIMIPIAHHPDRGACAMISLREPEELFGAARDARREGAEQGAEIAAGIAQGLETVYAATVKCFGQPDAVVMVPWATPPARVLATPGERREATAAGLVTAWCTLDALDGHIACIPVGAAFLRVAALTTIGAHGAQNAGTWATSRPMIRMRTAHQWTESNLLQGRPRELEQQRAAFFALEATRGDEIRAHLVAADPGTGELVAMADKVMTAADYRMEIPFPIHGLPDFSCASLRTLPFVERPLSLSTSWLARLPPQQVPPGFTPRPWRDILRGWARRAICASLNQTADHDFECYAAGASARKRPDYLCIGQGGGKQIAHADGIGSYNALSIVWELDTQTGLYGALDFARPGRTHWVLNMLRQLLGEHEDQQLMSLVMDGVRWGVQAPMQIRIGANLERLDERAKGVGEAFAKLIKKGLYYKYKKLRRADDKIEPDGPGPFITIPVYIVGTGGTDKPDNPHEKRIVGDQGMPHPEQAMRERNKPHGAPDGPLIVSMNDMMGPKPGTVPRGQLLDPLRYPMPEPESKPRPRHSYRNGAILSHMAHVNRTYKAGFKDDGRHMFFQFEQSPEEERTCAFVAVIPHPLLTEDGSPILDDDGSARSEPWFTLVIGTCMNMGSRNASKIAQRFTDRILEGFSQLLDVYVRDTWLPKQTPELQALLAERAAALGPKQARPYDTSGYTDDYKLEFVGPELLAAGARIWRTECRKANYWLSEKACAGTVLDYIGGRLVLNGGFGCITPSKRARAMADSKAAIDGRLTREQLESHNSFLVHVHEWLDFPMGTLKGLSAPLKLPGAPEQLATLRENVREQHRRIVELLQTRHAASFWSGIDEAARIGTDEDGAGFEAVIFAPRITSDACSDVQNPYICGVCNGLFFRFPIDGRWRQRHITVTETCGTILAITIFSAYFPHDELLVESDATASLASAGAVAAAEDLIYIRRRAEEIEAFRVATRRAWLLHCKGWANALPDAGSRDKMGVMYAMAAAMGIRLREVPIPPEAYAFMHDVLDNTSEASQGDGVHATTMGTHNLNMRGDMPIAQPNMNELIRLLNAALRNGAPMGEVARLTVLVAQYTGAKEARATTHVTIQMACRYLCEPHLFPTPAHAARAGGCAQRSCEKWVDKIEQSILADASADAAARAAQEQGGAGSQAMALPATCSSEEVIAIRSLVSLGGEQPLPAPPGGLPPPPTFPPSPPGTILATDAATLPTQKRARLCPFFARVERMKSTRARAARSATEVSGPDNPLPQPMPQLEDADDDEFFKQLAAELNGFEPPPEDDGAADSEAAPVSQDQWWTEVQGSLQGSATSAASERSTTDAESAHTDEYGAHGATERISGHQDLLCNADESPWAEFRAALEPTVEETSAPGDHWSRSWPRWKPRPTDNGSWEACGPEYKETWKQWDRHTDPIDTRVYIGQGEYFDPLHKDNLYHRHGQAVAHATARGTHNPSLIGDMPNAQSAAIVSPEPLAHARASQMAFRTEATAAQGTPAPLRRVSPRLGRQGATTAAAPSPHGALAGAGPRPTARTAKVGADAGAGTLDEVIGELARRSSPRRTPFAFSTEAIDLAIASHPSRTRPTSPQPANAAEARRQAAHDVAYRLVTHESQYALCPDRPDLLRGIIIDAAEARDAGIPHGTAGADEWGFKWVKRFAEATGNPWMRPRSVATSTDVLCEVWFAIMALVWIAQMIAPSARRRRAGYEQGMPTSALLALYGWRRVMRDCGRFTPDLTEVRGVLKGICARYKARWGDEAFVPNRKQPFSSRHMLEIVALLTRPVSTLVAWTATLRMAVLTAFCYVLSTGARKDEWTASFEGDSFVRRASFAWVDADGNDLPGTPEVIASRKNGDLLRGKSAPSKCDRLNIEWGGRDMWFRYDDTNPLNFARHWQQWEMQHPCPERERSWWPAFSPTGDSKPFTGKQADALLHTLLSKVMTEAEAARRSWHSGRITIATRLYARRGAKANGIAVDAIEGVIQSLVRWKTPEAMRIYARMEAARYADYVDMATDASVESDGTTPEDLPEVDPTGVLAENEATLAAIEAEAARATKGGRAARGDPVAKGGKQCGKRRATPATGDVALGVAEPEAKRTLYDIGERVALAHEGDESWGVIGQAIRLHSSFWGLDDGAYSDAHVVAYSGAYTFAAGNLSKHTYVVECEGHYYPATHDTVAAALTDASVKRRVKKAGLPRLL